MNIWPGVCDTFNILLQSLFVLSVCVFELLFDVSEPYVQALLHFVCLCGTERGSVHCGCLKKEEMKFNTEWIMEYVLLSAVCCSECSTEWNSCAEITNRTVCCSVFWAQCQRSPAVASQDWCFWNQPFLPIHAQLKKCPSADVQLRCFYHQEDTK